MILHTLVDRLLQREEINGHGACPTYLYRWTLLRLGPFAVYLHKFVGDDWSTDFHDHPKRFISIGLRGRYREERPCPPGWRPSTERDHQVHMLWNGNLARWYRAPWVRTFPATHQHRITMAPSETCWTLAIVGRKTREWGFWTEYFYSTMRIFVPWQHYVADKNIVEAQKTCP